MKVKAPTMRELEKAARRAGAIACYGQCDDPGDGCVVVRNRWGYRADFVFLQSAPQTRRQARWYALRHIEALKEMEEAGL